MEDNFYSHSKYHVNTNIGLTITGVVMWQCCYYIAVELVGYRMLLRYMLQIVYSTLIVYLTLSLYIYVHFCVNNPELQ